MNYPEQSFSETSVFPVFLLIVILVVFTLIAYAVCSRLHFAEQIIEEDDDEPEGESGEDDSDILKE